MVANPLGEPNSLLFPSDFVDCDCVSLKEVGRKGLKGKRPKRRRVVDLDKGLEKRNLWPSASTSNRSAASPPLPGQFSQRSAFLSSFTMPGVNQ